MFSVIPATTTTTQSRGSLPPPRPPPQPHPPGTTNKSNPSGTASHPPPLNPSTEGTTEYAELEKLKRKLKEQQQRLVTKSNIVSSNATTRRVSTPTGRNAAITLPTIPTTTTSSTPSNSLQTPTHNNNMNSNSVLNTPNATTVPSMLVNPEPLVLSGSPPVSLGYRPTPPSTQKPARLPAVHSNNNSTVEDDEETALMKKLVMNQERMEKRKTDMEANWARHPVDDGRSNSILPNNPSDNSFLMRETTAGSDEKSLLSTLGAVDMDAIQMVQNGPPGVLRSGSQVFNDLQKYIERKERLEEQKALLDDSVDMDNIGVISMRRVENNWSRHRDGNVLGATCLLRRDRAEQDVSIAERNNVLSAHPSQIMNKSRSTNLEAPTPRSTQLQLQQQSSNGSNNALGNIVTVSGCPLFRMVSKMNLAAVGQPTAAGIQSLLNELHHQGKQPQNVVWINMREEAALYINGSCHTLCESVPPFHCVRFKHIKGHRLEAMEERMRQDVLEESRRHAGNVALHLADVSKCVWEAASEDSVFTIGNLFRTKFPSIKFFRIPVGHQTSPTLADIDEILSITNQYPMHVIVFNCHSGRGRSTTAMMVSSLIRSFTHQHTNVYVSCMSPGPGNQTDLTTARYKALRRLLSIFPGGSEYEQRVAIVGNLCGGPVGQLREKIHQYMNSGVKEVHQRGLQLLQRYGTFIALTAYLDERYGKRKNVSVANMTFTEWMNERVEVRTVLTDIETALDEYEEEKDRVATPQLLKRQSEAGTPGRNGEILGPHMVLRDVVAPVITLNQGTFASSQTLEQVSSLRTVGPGVPMFAAAVYDPVGVVNLCNYVAGLPKSTITDGKPQRVHWVNIGIEPMVYIHQHPYALHDHLESEEVIIRGVSSERLAMMEERLKADVIAEIMNGLGTVVVHSPEGPTRIDVMPEDVSTPRDMAVTAANATARVRLHYHRFPTPPHNYMPSFHEIHKFISLVESLLCTMDSALVLVNRSGAGHSSMMLAMAALTYLRMLGPLSHCTTKASVLSGLSDVTVSEEETAKILEEVGRQDDEQAPDDEDEDGDPQLVVATKLMQVIGIKVLQDVVNTIINLIGKGSAWNCLHAMRAFSKASQQMDDPMKRASLLAIAVHNSKSYCTLLTVAAYLEEVGLSLQPTFPEWLETKLEIKSRLMQVGENPEEAVACVQYFAIPVISTKPSFSTSGTIPANRRKSTLNLKEGQVHTRRGNVLGANQGLKADHFPGCQKKDVVPHLPGAPNLRKVDFVNVYGCGIPTVIGIKNLLILLGTMEGTIEGSTSSYRTLRPHHGVVHDAAPPPEEEIQGPGYVVWINLREEPIMYVNNRPFVFRDLAQPYVNVEITGIETHSIERIEDTLREDVMAEASQCDGHILLHDEGKPCELVGVWEAVTPASVRTIRDVYDGYAKDGARIAFHRVPVTDEQSPEHKDFDCIVNILRMWMSQANQRGETQRISFVFNCQMGRGRTTTGMVICNLMLLVNSRGYHERLCEKYGFDSSFASGVGAGGRSVDYTRGEYKCIIALVRSLHDGREAKNLADMAIDTCDRMQNLRTAIEVFKKAVESTDTSEEGRSRNMHHGIHYLQRYFHLICFASYLTENMKVSGSGDITVEQTFESWMQDRPELTVLHDDATLE